MLEKWKQFVFPLIEDRNKEVKEAQYQTDIENQLPTLGWSKWNKEIKHKPRVPIGNGGTIEPDILVCKDEDNLFVIEVKRPGNKIQPSDVAQLQSYMRQLKLKVGVYIGEHIEVYYDHPERENITSVLLSELNLESANGLTFMEHFSKENFSKASLESFCKERMQAIKHHDDLIKLCNNLVDNAHTQICEALTAYLVKKHAGIFTTEEITQALSNYNFTATCKTQDLPNNSPQQIPQKPNDTNTKTKPSVWIIPANPKLFDHEGCFDKLGKIFWHYTKTMQRIKEGDLVYLYVSKPISSISFKTKVTKAQLSFNTEILKENAFSRNKQFGNDPNKKYFEIIQLKKIKYKALSLVNLLQHGLAGAPQGPICISQTKYKELLEYINNYSE